MKYGLIGERLGHSYSKIVHEQLADYTYDLIPLNEEEFHSFMEHKEFNAINVTIPYKCDVIPYLDEIDERAKQIGAVNAIVNRNGVLTGYNTDFDGFLYTLTHHQIEITGKKVLVLGYGGASKAVLAVLKKLEAKEIIIANRSVKGEALSYEEVLAHHTDASVIVNTTPVGMYPNVNESPISLEPFTSLTAVVDVIYNPLQTKLLKEAAERKILAINGLEMLLAQALYTVELFVDTTIPEEKIEELRLSLEEMLLS